MKRKTKPCASFASPRLCGEKTTFTGWSLLTAGLILILFTVGCSEKKSNEPKESTPVQSSFQHPLNPLSIEEIKLVKQVLLAERKVDTTFRFHVINLNEPPKAEMLKYKSGAITAGKHSQYCMTGPTIRPMKPWSICRQKRFFHLILFRASPPADSPKTPSPMRYSKRIRCGSPDFEKGEFILIQSLLPLYLPARWAWPHRITGK